MRAAISAPPSLDGETASVEKARLDTLFVMPESAGIG